MNYPILIMFALVASWNLPIHTLNGDVRSFPHDAVSPRSVFVVTFSESASQQGATWTRKLRDAHEQLAAAIFQVAVLEDVPKLFRSFVISAMTKTVPESLRDHFWVATTAGNEWQHCTESAATPNEAHIFVLDERDRIVWRAHGDCTEAKMRELLNLPQPHI